MKRKQSAKFAEQAMGSVKASEQVRKSGVESSFESSFNSQDKPNKKKGDGNEAHLSH